MSDLLTEKASPMWKGELYKKYIPLFSRARSYVRTKTHLYHFVEEYTRQLLTRQPRAEQSTESVKDTVEHPVSEASGVDEELLEEIVLEVNTEMSQVDENTSQKETEYFINEAKARTRKLLTRQPVQVDEEEEEQPPMDRETAGDKKYHELKDEDRLDRFGRRKQ